MNPFKKLLARIHKATAPQASSYHAAEVGRMFWDWVVAPTKADDEIKGDLGILRARARERGRNDAIAKYYLDLVANNLIGTNGIKLKALVRDNAGELVKGTNDTIQAAWLDFWADPWRDGRFTGLHGEIQLARSLACDGEIFVRVIYNEGPHGIKLQVVDPDLVDHTYNVTLRNGNPVRLGVECDKLTNAAVAYHVWNDYPNSGNNAGLQRLRIPAAEMIHVYDPQRANQTRGVTWFAPVLVLLKMLDGLNEAVLILNRISASKMGFFVHKDANGFDADSFAKMGEINAEPGTAMALPPGVEFQNWDTGQPGTSYEPFEKVLERTIASGLRVSYVSLFGNLTDTSYSSGRTGTQQERDNWKLIQRLYIDAFRRPLYKKWGQASLMAGGLRLPSRDFARFQASDFKPRTWPWIDPIKDLESARIAIGLGLGSRTDYADERGIDIEEVFEKLDKEQALASLYNINISGNPEIQEVPA